MKKIRVLGACAAAGGVVLLSGCVGVPADPYYGGGYSSGPYYSEPAPVVVPAPVYINGGGYYERRPRYYDRPYYDRPAYPVRPPPPAWGGGGRPVPPVAMPHRPPIAGGPGSMPAPPRGDARLMTSPDSKTQSPP
ncbi:hypothetical protein EJP69_01735 [Variovorax gossypii]|jgi:hypothetical protein|uniref:PXPV repeat-containing protein n=1 Tax=Variovorax gossypii TaxID=1679495 RepID=A0A431TQV3_9BURK|nr:hypothetical protein [Variovorax gossypii]RTQ36494.1 hypothetical protein EJP69_01735 [Variovorax gossypii]